MHTEGVIWQWHSKSHKIIISANCIQHAMQQGFWSSMKRISLSLNVNVVTGITAIVFPLLKFLALSVENQFWQHSYRNLNYAIKIAMTRMTPSL